MTDDIREKVLIRIVDDDPDVRDSTSFMLQCRGWEAAVYDSAEEFLRADVSGRPGCLLLDIRMPGMSGVELQRHMKEHRMRLPIIFMTGHADVDTAVETLKLGALDFLQKPVDADVMEKAVENASGISLAQALGRLLPQEVNRIFEEMSVREKAVTQLLLSGVVNKEIAERFAVSERTVQGHRNNIYHKLRVHNLQELQAQVQGADLSLLQEK